MKEHGDSSWRGVATVIDPKTGEPLGSVEYHHDVACDPPANERRLTVRTSTTIGTTSSSFRKEVIKLTQPITDVDLDGSYSFEHAKGLRFASELLDAAGAAGADAAAAGFVIEHCLGTTDDEQLRVLLAYDATTRELAAVLYLVESKA